MPHKRMEMHDALIEVNEFLRDYDPEVVLSAQTLGELAETEGLSPGVNVAVQRLHPVVQRTILGACKAAAHDGARPIYLSWHHGPIQRVEVTAPAAAGLPVDVRIESRYDEDGLGPSSTA